MIRIALCIILTLGALVAHAELEEESISYPWIKHEWQSEDFPVVYNRNIHREDFYGGCSVYLWGQGARMKVEGRDYRWHGKLLVQVAIFTKNDDGSIASSRPIPTETYVGEYDEKTGAKLPIKKGEVSKYSIPMSLPIAGYDVFQAHCMSEVDTLPPEARKVFQEMYRTKSIKQ